MYTVIQKLLYWGSCYHFDNQIFALIAEEGNKEELSIYFTPWWFQPSWKAIRQGRASVRTDYIYVLSPRSPLCASVHLKYTAYLILMHIVLLCFTHVALFTNCREDPPKEKRWLPALWWDFFYCSGLEQNLQYLR